MHFMIFIQGGSIFKEGPGEGSAIAITEDNTTHHCLRTPFMR